PSAGCRGRKPAADPGTLRRPAAAGPLADPGVSELAYIATAFTERCRGVARRRPGAGAARSGERPVARGLLPGGPGMVGGPERGRTAHPGPADALPAQPARSSPTPGRSRGDHFAA